MIDEMKFDHTRGGKIGAVIMAIVALFLIVMAIILFVNRTLDFMFAITLLITVISVSYISIMFYKPGFTELNFTKEGIKTKTNFDSEILLLEDIKGIWIIRPPFEIKEPEEYEEYSPQSKKLRGSLLIIGDLECFKDVKFVGLRGAFFLHDSFAPGYTTIYYRKKLDPILNFYYDKLFSKDSPGSF